MEEGQLALVGAVAGSDHKRSGCSTCLQLGRAAVGLLDEMDAEAMTWPLVVRRMHTTGSAPDLDGHVDQVDEALLLAYEALLQRLLVICRRTARLAPTWEASAILTMRATVRELDAYPGAARLHYVEANRDAFGVLRQAREHYRERLTAQTRRDDSPPDLGIEVLAGMVRATLSGYLAQDAGSRTLQQAMPSFDSLVQSFAAVPSRVA